MSSQNYTMLQKIGSGSYSTVYRAKDNRDGKLVALKIMKFPYTKGKRLQDMELNALKKFKSNPCVIPLLQSFIQNDVMYMAFELGGTTLIDYYRKHARTNKFTEEEVKIISYQIAVALSDMHRFNYMHRDLKPENIMIEPETKLVRLVDFGLCKRWQSDVNTNYVTTRWYRSPELILNLPYGPNIDVFALGCVMLELYLGYEAFPGKDAIDQLNKVFSVTGTPTKQQWPEGMAHLEQKRIVFPLYEKANLKEHMPAISEAGIDLISNMILCNRKERYCIKQVLEHVYFKNLDTKNLPQVVQRYTRQIHPPVIQYPLKINTTIKEKSTNSSTLREPKKKLELVSNSLVNKRQTSRLYDNQLKIKESSEQMNKTFTSSYENGVGLGTKMQSQSVRGKKKLNLTLLDKSDSVRNKTSNQMSSEFDETFEARNRGRSINENSTNRENLKKFFDASKYSQAAGLF